MLQSPQPNLAVILMALEPFQKDRSNKKQR